MPRQYDLSLKRLQPLQPQELTEAEEISDRSQIEQGLSRSHQVPDGERVTRKRLLRVQVIPHILQAEVCRDKDTSCLHTGKGQHLPSKQRDLSLQKAGAARGKFLSPKSTIQDAANNTPLGKSQLYILV